MNDQGDASESTQRPRTFISIVNTGTDIAPRLLLDVVHNQPRQAIPKPKVTLVGNTTATETIGQNATGQ